MFSGILSAMGYKHTVTTCTVQLVAYRNLPATTTAMCETLRREAGRCWTDLVQAHLTSRDAGMWLTEADLRALTKGGRYCLHSQSIQALGQRLLANVDTARSLRQQEQVAGGDMRTRFPYKPKAYTTVTWKDQAIRVRDGRIFLPNGRGQPDLALPLPARLQHVNIRKVELLWRADHYQLALTVERPPEPPLLLAGQTAGVDLGEINPAAVVTEAGQALVINGRLLRHHKQLRNKRHAAYQERMVRCRKGSRRWKRLKRQRARASAKLYRQQRNHLHQASRKVVAFAVQQNVNRLAVGDVRDVADGVDKGAVANQKLSQWPHGQFIQYLSYKARRQGIAVEQIPEDYSTQTCSYCNHRRASAPRGRVFCCPNPGCGAIVHRDGNGAANICSRACFGVYGKIHPLQIKHLRATVVRATTLASVAGSASGARRAFGTPPEPSRL